MRVLLTGGTGFLGRAITAKLLALGHAVRLLGRDFAEARPLLAEGAQPVQADLRDHPAIVAACRGMDAVIHCGARSAPWGSPALFEAVNVGGTEAVLAGCRRHAVGRMVLISSPAVVFDGRDVLMATEATPIPRRFSSHYARSKAAAEALLQKASDIHSVILRPKALFGPGDRALLPRVVAAARAGRLPQIGDGQNRVDVTYVANAAHAAVLALTAPVPSGKVYHITNGEHVPLWELIRTVLHRLGVRASLRPVPVSVAVAAAALMEAAAAVSGREPLLTRYTAAVLGRTQTYDISAARRDLGYAPLCSVAEGVERTLAAWRA
jgi:nucleoside-diphosphate-sugar epimerase